MSYIKELSNKKLWRMHGALGTHVRILREAWRIARCRPCRDAIQRRIRQVDERYREVSDELWERVINPCADCSGRCGCSGATEG